MNQLLEALFYETRKNAGRRQIPFDLTMEDYERIVAKHDGKCAVTGIEFSWHWQGTGNRRPFAASIDRKDSSRGYVLGNVRLVCVAANLAMNTWGDKVLIKMAKAICGDMDARKCEASQEPESVYAPPAIKGPARYLNRAEAAQYVTALGLPVAKTTLQKMVTTGGGPAYRRFGHRAVYLPTDLDTWVFEKMSTPRCSSSCA